MTVVAEDLDVVAFEWPDDGHECGVDTCPATAHWWYECRSCGTPTYLCRPCRTALDAALAAHHNLDLMCEPCGARLPLPFDWHPIGGNRA